MTYQQFEELIALQTELCNRSMDITDEEIFTYTIGLMIERWCEQKDSSPAFIAKMLWKRLRREK